MLKASVTDDRGGAFLEQQVNVARGHGELTMRKLSALNHGNFPATQYWANKS